MQEESVYSIHILSDNGEIVFTSVPMMIDETISVFHLIQVNGDLQKRIYDVFDNQYVEHN